MKRGPKTYINRGLDIQKQFASVGVQTMPAVLLGGVDPDKSTPKLANSTGDKLLDDEIGKAVSEKQIADQMREISQREIPLNELPNITHDFCFGDIQMLEAILMILLNENSLLMKVQAGLIAPDQFSTLKSIARVCHSLWPEEIHSELILYQKSLAKGVSFSDYKNGLEEGRRKPGNPLFYKIYRK